MHLVVDGMNVIGSRPDGWWRDRAGARRRLVERLGALVGPQRPVTVVFDGRPGAGERDGTATNGVCVRFAPGGPNAADDLIVTLVGGASDGPPMTVITSDRTLVERIRRLGAEVESSSTLTARLGWPDRSPGGEGAGRRRGRPRRG